MNALIFLLYLSLMFRLFFNFINCRSKMISLMQLLEMPYLTHCFSNNGLFYIVYTHHCITSDTVLYYFCAIIYILPISPFVQFVYFLFSVLLTVSMKVTGYVILRVCIVRARFFIFIVCSYICF